MDPETILAGLNDEQREAATATTGPVVILLLRIAGRMASTSSNDHVGPPLGMSRSVVDCTPMATAVGAFARRGVR